MVYYYSIDTIDSTLLGELEFYLRIILVTPILGMGLDPGILLAIYAISEIEFFFNLHLSASRFLPAIQSMLILPEINILPSFIE